MIRYHCAPFPASFDLFCNFLQKSACLPCGYEKSSYKAPLERVYEVLRLMGAETLVLQDRVRDPDYFAEYQTYYLKQHRYVSPQCARVHAFKTQLPAGLENLDPIRDVIDKAVSGDYLGFVTLRPLIASPVAATILQAPPYLIVPCIDRFPVHIAGVDLEVTGTPFLQQDNAVGACAQASMWMALRTQRRRAGNAAFNTAELTVAATRYLMEDRVFPGRGGLNVGQMLQAIRFAGHEPSVTRIPRAPNKDWERSPHYQPAKVDEARMAIEPYVDSGLPVILCLQNPVGKGHTVTAIGRTQDGAPAPGATTLVMAHSSAGLHDFIVHNDNEGPYLELQDRDPDDYDGWSMNDVQLVIVPLPEGVTVSAAELYVAGANWLGRLLPPLMSALKVAIEPQSELVTRHFLMERHAFRKHMHLNDEATPNLKDVARTMDLPPWLWIYEVHLHSKYSLKEPSRVALLVFDATSDIDEYVWPLIAHVNGALVDNTCANQAASMITPAAADAKPELVGPSNDDRLALPIPPQAHIHGPAN